MEVFDDRADAGRRLAGALAERPAVQQAGRVVVLAIPRGGVPVGAEVADRLGAALDVVVVRKLRAPRNPELGYGAVGPDGVLELDRPLVERLGLTREEIDREVRDRLEVVTSRLERYRARLDAQPLQGATAVVVDDGIATGSTARQACRHARGGGAGTVVLAVPVAPRGTAEVMAEVADEVVVLTEPAEFLAVGQAYRSFPQLADEEVDALLDRAAGDPR